MRRTPISVASLCLLVVALAAPLTAQGGGKKKHAVDSSHTVLTVQTDQTVAAAIEETTGTQHVGPSNGPIVVNWKFKENVGAANLMVYPDGNFLFSGIYGSKVPDRDIEVVLGLKSKFGGVFRFHYLGNVSKGGVKWSKKGQSDLLKDGFKAFAEEHAWGGAYRFPLTAEAKKEKKKAKAELKALCAEDAWMDKQEWARADPSQQCHQFNDNWY